MATFTWVISTLERDLLPEEMNGAVVVAHWRCNAEQVDGDNTYNASSYGTCGFTPDPTAPDYIAYEGLQANIDAQITPATATGTPW